MARQPAQPALPLWRRWAFAWMPGLTVLLMALAFEPVGQFYLAWVALVPWLLYLPSVRSQGWAFGWGWAMGVVYFGVMMWWLIPVTFFGMVALVLYMALYWGAASALLGPMLRRFSDGPTIGRSILLALAIPTCITGLELVRANLWTGIAFINISHTQVKWATICQIADFTGAYGVTFWVAAINGAICAMANGRKGGMRDAICPLTFAILLTAALFVYGKFRLAEEEALFAGPVVTVVQSNIPQSNTGDKGASEEEIVAFHLAMTERAMGEARAKGLKPDLVVWSETMMPPLNAEARQFLQRRDFFAQADQQIGSLARKHDVSILAGGVWYGDFRELPNGKIGYTNTNCAYFYDPTGRLSEQRYDKVHLVPFGEFIPFKKTLPWLYRFFLSLTPYDFDYTVHPGDEDALTVFTLSQHESGRAVRFVTPICFEDVDSVIVARMFGLGRPDFRGLLRAWLKPETALSIKRADLLVNITNDGWFARPELYLHRSSAVFRSIENRVPSARSVNTGLSGFIDSSGRTFATLPPRTEGFSTSAVKLDLRVAPYTRLGDWFATLCVWATGGGALVELWWASRRRRRLDAGVRAK